MPYPLSMKIIIAVQIAAMVGCIALFMATGQPLWLVDALIPIVSAAAAFVVGRGMRRRESALAEYRERGDRMAEAIRAQIEGR